MVVRFSDLDPFDHVNHARYLSYFESGRIEALADRGYGIDALKASGLHLVLAKASIEYHRSARLHDVLEITTELVVASKTSSVWHQEAHSDGELVATLDVKSVFTNSDGRPVRAPKGFFEAMA